MSKRQTRTEEEQRTSGDSIRKALTDAFEKMVKALPQRTGKKTQKFQRITLEPEDATWISSVLYEECILA